MNSQAIALMHGRGKLFSWSVPLLLLLSGSAVMAAGGLEPASGMVKDTSADYGVSAAAEENASTPVQDETPRATRRARTSLSMPYFSFAQALRPRS
ncbi:MAG TPA: hypothetical protein VEP93_01830 [Variovorax sp.]|nr:hypothetical protein [Variovorax sp.]